MNYQLLNKPKEQSLNHQIQNFFFQYFPVQNSHKNLLTEIETHLNYAATFMIFYFSIVQLLGKQIISQKWGYFEKKTLIQSKGPQYLANLNDTQMQVLLALYLSRLFLMLVYVFVQRPILITTNKCLIVASIFITADLVKNDPSSIQNYTNLNATKWVTLIIELSGLGIWAFKKQNRIKPGLFDSRLSSFLGYAKEASAYLLVFFASQIVMYYNDNTSKIASDSNSLIMVNLSIRELYVAVYVVIALTVCLYCDCFDLMYNSTFKILSVSFDSALIFLFASQLYLLQFYHVPFPNQGTNTGTGQSVSFLLFFLVLSLLLTFNILRESDQIDHALLFKTQFFQIQHKSQAYIIRYFEELRKMCSLVSGKKKHIYAVKLVNYIEFHRKQCSDLDCPITARYSTQKSTKEKTQILLEMIVVSLGELSVIRPDVKRYLVYYLSPEDRVFKYLDEDVLYMRRERFRINSDVREVSNQIIMLDAQTNKLRIVDLIQRYITAANQFFQGLLSEKINAQATFSKGFEMLQALEKIEEAKRQAENFTQEVRTLLNNFTSRMIKTPDSKILDTVVDPPFLLKKTTDSGPIIIISAERHNFASFIDVNTSCTKELYYTRKELLSLTILDVLPLKIRQPHRILFKKVAKRTIFNGRRDDLTFTIFIQNKLGYASLSTAIIYMINSIKGRMWCVSLTVRHKMDSILIVQDKGDGTLMQMTEMTVFHGLKLVHKNLELAQSVLSRLKSTVNSDGASYRQVLILANQPFFKGNNFSFQEDKIMQITEKIEAFNLTYILIKINSKVVVESERTRDKNQIKKMMRNSEFGQSLENNISKLKTFNESQFEEGPQIPLRQFHYHSDGVVRNYEQDSERVKQRFLVDDFPTDKRRNAENFYGSEITEMRLCKGNVLDFIQNMEVEDQFQAKPQPAQVDVDSLNRFKMTNQIFKESLFIQREKSTAPQLVRSRIFYGIIFLLFISILIAINQFLMHYLQSFQDNQNIMLSLSNVINGYVATVNLILSFKYYSFNQVSIAGLLAYTGYYRRITIQNWQSLHKIDSSIQTFFNQKKVDDSLEEYNIQINELQNLLTWSPYGYNYFNQSVVMNQIISSIIPSFNYIIKQKVGQFTLEFQQRQQFIILLTGLAIIIAVCILAWTIGMNIVLQRKQKLLASIFGQIEDYAIHKQLARIYMFQQFLYLGKDIYDDEDILHRINLQRIKPDKINNNTTVSKYRKSRQQFQRKVCNDNIYNGQQASGQGQYSINPSSSNKQNQQSPKSIIIHSSMLTVVAAAVWILMTFCLLAIINIKLNELKNLNSQIFISQYYLNGYESAANDAWLRLNQKFPFDQEQLKKCRENMHFYDREFQRNMITIINFDKFSTLFRLFYQEIWFQNTCDYLEPFIYSCRKYMGGAIKQGGSDLIVAFLRRKFDMLIEQKYTQQKFRSLPETKQLSQLQVGFFYYIKNMNMIMIEREIESIKTDFGKSVKTLTIEIFIVSSLIVLIYKMVSFHSDRLLKIERLLHFVQYENLESNSLLKKYFKENFYDRAVNQ